MRGSMLYLKYLKFVPLFFFVLFLPFFTVADTKPLTIVFSNDGHTNPYQVELLSSFENALEAYNKEFGNITGYWLSASRIEEQLEQINLEIEKGVDILFVNAMSVEAMTPLVQKAKEKGIIWVAVHNNMANADFNFVLGDYDNGYNQGMALGTYFNGHAKVAIMLGMRANQSGNNRRAGILNALQHYPNINIIAQEPADWSTSKAIEVGEKWFKHFENLDAISVVTDTYLYPVMAMAASLDYDKILFFGHDGDKQILNEMTGNGRVKADILLSATREGWNFVQLAYKIANNIPVEERYNFYTPLVLSPKTYAQCLKNGFFEDVEVVSPEQALALINLAIVEFGPQSVKKEQL